MTALIQHGLTGLPAAEDEHQRWCLLVVLSEVTAEPALSVMKRLHFVTSLADESWSGWNLPELLCASTVLKAPLHCV